MLKFVVAANQVYAPLLKWLIRSLEYQGYSSDQIMVYDLGNLGYGKPFNATVRRKTLNLIPSKPFIIEDALKRIGDNDTLVWLDCDVLVRRKLDELIDFDKKYDMFITHKKLTTFFEELKHKKSAFYIPHEYANKNYNEQYREGGAYADNHVWCNAGVLAFRKSILYHEFFSVWKYYSAARGSDQRAISTIFKKHKQEIQPGCQIDNCHGATIKVLNWQWNALEIQQLVEHADSVKIMHYRGGHANPTANAKEDWKIARSNKKYHPYVYDHAGIDDENFFDFYCSDRYDLNPLVVYPSRVWPFDPKI